MTELRKNKIFNPQFVTDETPESISSDDVGRLWVDAKLGKFVVGINDKRKKSNVSVALLTDIDRDDIDEKVSNTYFSELIDFYAIIEAQQSGDRHFDAGFDFFTDDVFLKNTDQVLDDYYSFYYVEVENKQSQNYIRTISTQFGEAHIRCANGHDTYLYDNALYKVVNYSKIILPTPVKKVIDLRFDNKDTVENGFILHSDKKTIYIYGDPEGFFLNKTVKVRCLN